MAIEGLEINGLPIAGTILGSLVIATGVTLWSREWRGNLTARERSNRQVTSLGMAFCGVLMVVGSWFDPASQTRMFVWTWTAAFLGAALLFISGGVDLLRVRRRSLKDREMIRESLWKGK